MRNVNIFESIFKELLNVCFILTMRNVNRFKKPIRERLVFVLY